MKTHLLLITLSLLLSNLTLAQTGQVRAEVSNLKNNQGLCRFCLFVQAEGFPDTEKQAVKCASAPIRANKSSYVFDNIPSGTYAISSYHDTNSNARLDTNFMGVPKEDYGCSNNARGGLSSPPRFEAAQFTHKQAETVIAGPAQMASTSANCPAHYR